MGDQITQQQVNQAAWAACDTFRGAVDPAQYKDYILAMLFVKYISDLWNDHVETYRKQFGGDDARIRRRLERERFMLPEGTSFYDLYEARNEANIGELINMALEKIEDQNRTKLEGVFRNIDLNSEANLGRVKDCNRRLKNMLEDFAKPALDLRPSRVTEDIIGKCYIYLISRFASDAGKKAGEFYTPAAVPRLLAKLAAPTVDMDKLYVARAGVLIVNITFAWEGAIALVPSEHDGCLVSHRFPMFIPRQGTVCPRYLRHTVRMRASPISCRLFHQAVPDEIEC